MNLGIDLIGTNLESGTKTFNINLLNQILISNSKDNIYIFICKHYLKYLKNRKIPKNIKLIIKSNLLSIDYIKILWMQVVLPIELKILKINKIFSPMNYCPLICNILNIEIILNTHTNLPWIYFNKMPGSKIKNFLIKTLMGLSIKCCNKLIVNSNFAKKEIVKKLNIKSKKVFVNYLGADNISLKKKSKSINFDFKTKYILSVSSCVKYHDFFNILNAFKDIKKKRKNLKLVFITQIFDQKYFYNIKNYVEENFSKQDVFFFQNINSNQILRFYKNAIFYIFSSYCEVFGLTSLEAMKNNCPVMISRSSALPEVNGKASLYFNPNHSKDIKFKMNRLILSSKLRKSLVNKGKKQVKNYKWSQSLKHIFRIIDLKI